MENLRTLTRGSSEYQTAKRALSEKEVPRGRVLKKPPAMFVSHEEPDEFSEMGSEDEAIICQEQDRLELSEHDSAEAFAVRNHAARRR